MPRLRLRPQTVASVLVAAAIAASTIVFSEPAIADVLMLAVIGAVPMLGVSRYGRMALVNLVLWFTMIGLALIVVPISTSGGTALTHQLVTIFLVIGAFVLAGYITADPEPRFDLVMRFYLVACMIATAAAVVGYFSLLPGTYDMFTNHGRARGTFKDPNVYGAVLVPAFAYVLWLVLREPWVRVRLTALLALPLILGLLLSFSRGAWISVVAASGLMLWLAAVRTRRKQDRYRFAVVTAAGAVAVIVMLGVASQLPAVRGLLEQRASLDQSYDQGPDGRFGGQAKARMLALENPFGIGTHTFRTTYHHEEPHNVYLSTFLNAGWIGGAAYIFSVLMTLVVALRGALRMTALQGPFIVAGCAFAGLVIEGFVIDSDHWRHFFILMACIWGLTDAELPVRASDRRQNDPMDA